MKASSALVLFVSLGSVVLAAEGRGAVRAMDPPAAQACEHGRAASPSFRALLALFDPDQVVVHVVSGDTLVFGTSGTTRLAGTAGGWRYLRIVVDPDLSLNERTAVLAHELQHAREIIAADALTQRDVRRLYERIGRPVLGAHDMFETSAAADTGTRVWRELRATTARHTRPAEARAAAIRVQ